MNTYSREWQLMQNSVAKFLEEYGFVAKEEFRLKSGKRIDIVALKKNNELLLHVLVEVKNWKKVSRKQESDFCKQMIQYIIEYSLEEKLKTDNFNNPVLKGSIKNDLFVGILCLTKDAHFSFRRISQHFIDKNEHILGIPIREEISKKIKLFVTKFDLLPRVFEEIGYPLLKKTSIMDFV